MKGNLRQRSQGSWTLTVELPRDPSTGRRRQVYETFAGTKRKAQDRLAELIAQVQSGTVRARGPQLGTGAVAQNSILPAVHAR